MRSGTTVLLGLAGLAWTTGQAVLPDMGATIEARYARVADAPTLQALSVGLLFTAGGLLVLGSLSATKHLPQGPGRRLVAVGVRLTALGGLWLAAGRAMFNLQFLTYTNIPRDTALPLLEASPSPADSARPDPAMPAVRPGVRWSRDRSSSDRQLAPRGTLGPRHRAVCRRRVPTQGHRGCRCRCRGRGPDDDGQSADQNRGSRSAR